MSEPITITLDQMREAIDQAIALKGEDYRYKDDHDICVYFETEEETPSCAIGYAVVNLGIEEQAKAAIREWQKDEHYTGGYGGLAAPYQPSAGQLVRYLVQFGVEIDEVASAYADEVQSAQDNGARWGQARHRASERIARIFRIREMVKA